MNIVSSVRIRLASLFRRSNVDANNKIDFPRRSLRVT
jgi:hypothetical protein